MPMYLCHGFRWTRQRIREHVVIENIDEAAPEWIIESRSTRAIVDSFWQKFDFLPSYYNDGCPLPGVSPRSGSSSGLSSIPSSRQSSAQHPNIGAGSPEPKGKGKSKSTSKHKIVGPYFPPSTSGGPLSDADLRLRQRWCRVQLLEEYDPNSMMFVSQPYAYVADHVVRGDTSSVPIFDEIRRYEERQARSASPAVFPVLPSGTDGNVPEKGWFEQLRDELEPNAKIGWFLVYNRDEERAWKQQPAQQKGTLIDIKDEPQKKTTSPGAKSGGPDNQGSGNQDANAEQQRRELRLELGGDDEARGRSPGPRTPPITVNDVPVMLPARTSKRDRVRRFFRRLKRKSRQPPL